MLTDKKHYSTLLSLWLVVIIDTLSFSLIWPLIGPLFTSKAQAIVPYAMSLPMRDLLYGITIALFPIFAFFGSPILGDLSDYIGRKKVILVCLFGISIGFVVSVLAIFFRDFYLLFLGRALQGAFASNQAIAQAAMIDVVREDKKTLGFSFIAFANSLGLVFGPLLGGVLSDTHLVSWFSVLTPFIVAALLPSVNAIILIFTFKDTFKPKSSVQITFTKGINVFLSIFKDVKIRMLAAIYFCQQLAWATYFQFNVIYLIQVHNYTGTRVGYFVAWLAAIAALNMLFVVRIVTRFLRLKNMLYFSLILNSLGMLLAYGNTEFIIWLSAIPAVSGAVLASTALLTAISDAVPKESQGWGMGVASAVSPISWMISALTVGLLGHFENPIIFILTTAIALIALSLSVNYFRTQQNTSMSA
jgi:MFS transporter, DHA1 family, tetracycline resistance protein